MQISIGKSTWGLVTLVLLSGCAGTVVAPDPAAVSEPRPVFLLDHGRHASLVLSTEDDALIRYLYGDWRWYAHRETGFFRAFPTLLSRTQATLGRRELDGPPLEAAIRDQVPVSIRQVHEFHPAGARVDALIARLDLRFRAAIETLHDNPGLDLEFVHDPRPYTLLDNSNHVVARWLMELGIEVYGNPIWGWWRVRYDELPAGQGNEF